MNVSIRGRHLDDQLTTLSRVLIQKLQVAKVVNKFPSFYLARRFIIVFTSQSMDPHLKAVETNPRPQILHYFFLTHLHEDVTCA